MAVLLVSVIFAVLSVASSDVSASELVDALRVADDCHGEHCALELRQMRADVNVQADLNTQSAKEGEGEVDAAWLLTTMSSSGVKFSSFLAEFIAMTLFVVIGCGSAMGIAKEQGYAWVLQVSLTFGFAITALAYAIGHYSGGQINCAVTLGLVLVGNVTVAQGIINVIGQLLGSIFGAVILCFMYPAEKDRTQSLASNSVNEGFGSFNALVGEFMMTLVLVFVVIETAVNPMSLGNRPMACVAIGFAVFLGHSVLIPIDGCSINPTRSFGPALVAQLRYSKASNFRDMWIFWFGPLLGACAAAGIHGILHSAVA